MKLHKTYCLILIAAFFSCSSSDNELISIEEDLTDDNPVEDDNSVLNLPVPSFNYSFNNFPSSFNDFVMDVLDNTPADNPTTDVGK